MAVTDGSVFDVELDEFGLKLNEQNSDSMGTFLRIIEKEKHSLLVTLAPRRNKSNPD